MRQQERQQDSRTIISACLGQVLEVVDNQVLGVDQLIRGTFQTCRNSLYLDNNMSLPCSCPVEITVFLHHDDLPLLLHTLCVQLNAVENVAVLLLCDAHKLHTNR